MEEGITQGKGLSVEKDAFYAPDVLRDQRGEILTTE
jgi:hypothetical protein